MVEARRRVEKPPLSYPEDEDDDDEDDDEDEREAIVDPRGRL